MRVWQLFFGFIFVFFFIFCFAYAHCHMDLPADDEQDKTQGMLRVMTFNLWFTGERIKDGAAKIMRHLKVVDPDIVLFQECWNEKFTEVLSKGGWNSSFVGNDTAVATKHAIKTDETYRIKRVSVVPIFVSTLNLTVTVVNQHLTYRKDGAETLLINNNNRPVEERIQIAMSNEKELRLEEQITVLSDEKLQKIMATSKLAGTNEIVILGGDFNTPSHLDWGEDTKQNHDNIVFEWPVSKLLQQTGFIDSYRAVYKNASEQNGNTWSSINAFSGKYPEPQNRIDYLFYYDNGKVEALYSEVYQGDKPVQKNPNHHNNDWPSDHRAVFTDFRVMLGD